MERSLPRRSTANSALKLRAPSVIETIVAERVCDTANACRILDVNRTAFYAWKNASQTIFDKQDDELSPLTRVIFKKHRRRYGARRVIADLRELGHVCSRRKVSDIMKTLQLKAIQPKSFVPKTTNSRHRLGYSPNLLLESNSPTQLDEIWVGDITYISLDD